MHATELPPDPEDDRPDHTTYLVDEKFVVQRRTDEEIQRSVVWAFKASEASRTKMAKCIRSVVSNNKAKPKKALQKSGLLWKVIKQSPTDKFVQGVRNVVHEIDRDAHDAAVHKVDTATGRRETVAGDVLV